MSASSHMDTYRPLRVNAVAPEPSPARQQLRPIFLRTGVVTQAVGSAYIEVGKTKILCSVYGPRQSRNVQFSEQGRLWCDFKFAPFAQDQRRRRGQDPDEREYSMLVAEALEVSVLVHKFPKNVVEVYVLVLEDDGGAVAAALICASLALADAGIELYDLVAASSASFIESHIVLDPRGSEESRLFASLSSSAERETSVASQARATSQCAGIEGGLLLAYMPSIGQITHLAQVGSASQQTVTEAITMCTDACSKIYTLMTEHLQTVTAKKLSNS